jgi:AGZA family xanthine/uracil permease-like MFS transporter
MAALESFFQLSKWKTDVRTEVVAGITTFMVSAYIIFVNPAILANAGMPFAPTLAVTCLIAAVLTLAYGLYAKYPFLIAPGMGLNAVVAFQLVLGKGLSWQEAMGVIFLEGLIILILVLTGFRQTMMNAIPTFLKKAIGVGIGLFILIIGLVEGGLIKAGAGTVLTIGDYNSIPVAVTLIGLVITIALYLRKVPGALLWGILITTVVAVGLNAMTGWTAFAAIPGAAMIPTSIFQTPDFSNIGAPFISSGGQMPLISLFAKMGVLAAVLTIFSLMLSDFFDTMGTIVGIGAEAGFLDKDGQYPPADLTKILVVDSLGAMLGGAVGSSSATTYIESAAGVAEGGRTGLTSVVTAILFALAMFLAPIAGIVPPQATAPALILVGLFMCAVVGDINWRDADEALPALMTITMMPFTYSITNGIGWGFIVYGLVKLIKGEAGKIHPMLWVVIAAFMLYFALPVLGF